jgi:transcriptional regulator GlxA family with amidase domain
VKDGNIYTSAGISAGIDLALAWVEEDCGSATAHDVARELSLFLRRPGGQPQLSLSLTAQASEMRVLQELQVLDCGESAQTAFGGGACWARRHERA